MTLTLYHFQPHSRKKIGILSGPCAVVDSPRSLLWSTVYDRTITSSIRLPYMMRIEGLQLADTSPVSSGYWVVRLDAALRKTNLPFGSPVLVMRILTSYFIITPPSFVPSLLFLFGGAFVPRSAPKPGIPSTTGHTWA